MKVRNRSTVKTRVLLSSAALAALSMVTGKASAQAFHNIALWDFNQYSPPNPKATPNLNNPLSDPDFSTSLGYSSGKATGIGLDWGPVGSTGNPITQPDYMASGWTLADGSNFSRQVDDMAAQGGSTNPTGQSWRVRGGNNLDLTNTTRTTNGWTNQAPEDTQGVQFSIDTTGETAIKFKFDWFVTGQGIANLREEYSTDNGATFIKANATGLHTNAAGQLVTPTGGGFLNSNVLDLSGVAGADGNTNLIIRLVTEKDPTTLTYRGASNTDYNNQSGNWRFQDVSFFSTNQATVIVPPALTWNPGSNGTGAGNLWNKDAANQNWVSTNVTNASFGTSNAAFFTGSGLTGGTGVVNVDAAGITAATMNVSNTNGTYTFTGGPMTGKLIKTGAGNLVLAASGSNNFSSLEINGGTLHAATDLSLGAAGVLRPQLTINGATLVADNAITYNRFIIAGANGMTLDSGSNNVTFGGLFSAQGPFTKVGLGNLTFGTSSASTAGPGGFFTIQQGNVIFAQTSATAVIVAPNTLGGFSGNLILASKQLLGINGGTVDSTNGSNIQIQVSGGGIGGDSSGGTSLSQVIINEPILLNSLGKPGVFKSSLGMNGTGNSLTINGIISGNSDIQFDGGKALVTLNATAAYVGDNVINNGDIGVIRLGANNALSTGNLTFGTGTNNTAQLGAIDLNGHNQTVKSLRADNLTVPNVFIAPGQKLGGIANTSPNLSILTVSGTSSTIFLGSIGTPEFTNINNGQPANAIQLVLGAANTGSLTLRGPNDFNGGVVINGGTLQIDPNVFISGTNNAGQNSSALPDYTSVTNNASFIVNSAGFNNTNATLTTDITGTGTTTVTGGAAGSYTSSLTTNTMTQGALVNHGNTIINTGGTIGPVSGTGSLSIGNGGSSALVSVASVTQASVTVSDQANLQIVGTPGRSTSTVTALTISGTGQLDVGANTLLVDRTATPFSQILGYVASGRNGNNWNGSGINSSFLATGTNRSKYGLAAIDGGAPLDNNVGILASQIIVRAALIGDAQLSGAVNFADINQIITHGRYGLAANPALTHWSDGDFNGDNKVDFLDINAIISAGNFNAGGAPFVAEAAGVTHAAVASVAGVHTAKLTSANPAVTTTGTAGDGIPDFSYDALTGDVKFFRDGYDVAKNVRSVVLLSAGNKFITGVGYTAAGNDSFDVDQTDQQAVGRFNGKGITANPLDLGNILPLGLTTSQLQSDLSLYFNYDGSGAADPNGVPVGLIVPEPTTLSLLSLGAVGLLARRRRKAK